MGQASARSTVVDEIGRFNQDRKPKLVKLKYQRMAGGAFAFFRGTDHLFASAWPELRPSDVGPAILISGDLHLENFGAYRTDDGDFRYDINDFDEALVAPCSLDLVRCTTSILLAGEEWTLTPVQAAGIALVFLDAYQQAVRDAPASDLVGEVTPTSGTGPLWDLLGATALGNQAKLLNHATAVNKAGVRQIQRIPEKTFDLRDKRVALIRKAVQAYGRQRKMAGAYHVLDVTGRVAGIGSLGLRRYLVLTEGDGGPDGNRLLDIKEARPSSLLSCTDSVQPDTGGNEALRVVRAQRQLTAWPPVGLDVIDVDGRPFRMREMVPDENRSRLDLLQHEPDKLRSAVAMAGRLTGWSQVRGARLEREDRVGALARWATGPALDSVLAAAVRYADRTIQEFQEFAQALQAGRLGKARG